MSAKNRQGCCCGSSLKCLNGCKVCDEQYLKGGVVTDDLGDHPFKQPTATRPWQTDWIEWTTDEFTDGDCVAKTGTAYYRYELACIDEVELTEPNRGGMSLIVRYSATACPLGVHLFDSTKPSDTGGAIDTQAIPHDSVSCDPITASFSLTQQFGLDAPWLNPTVAFDVDEPSTSRCPCRNCGGVPDPSGIAHGFYPDGDVILSYNIDNGIDEAPISGSVRLTKTPIYDGGATYYWIGNVDWWDRPSYSNPTNAPGGHNVELRCSGLAFLEWGYGIVSGPHAQIVSSGEPGSATFTLFATDGIHGTKNGTAKTKDAPDAGLKGLCCFPCDLPKKDLKITYVEVRTPIFPAGPPTTTTLYSVDLEYSKTPWEMPYGSDRPGSAKMSHWRSEPVLPRPLAPFKVAVYFDCLSLYDEYAVIGINVVYGGNSPSYPYGSIDGTGPGNWPTSGFGITGGSGSICDPFHLDYASEPVPYSGPLPIGVGSTVTHIYIDEIA